MSRLVAVLRVKLHDQPGIHWLAQMIRVLQVATLATSRGASGGPIAVAQSHCEALRSRGADATLLAGRRREDPPESSRPWEHFIPVRRVAPTPAFTGYWSLMMVRALWRAIKKADVVHVHLARDLVPLTACYIGLVLRKPLYVQCHGMVVPQTQKLRRVIDLLLVAPLLRRVQMAFTYDANELTGLERIAGRQLLCNRVLNGATTPEYWNRKTAPSDDSEVWSVIFAARLHPRKRVAMYLAAARRLRQESKQRFLFQVFGPDEGDWSLVAEACADGSVHYGGALSLESLRRELVKAHILVLPSVNEPFSLTILDAQAVGCPVVVSSSNGFAPYVSTFHTGAVFEADDIGSLTSSIQNLVANREAYLSAREAARELIQTTFSWDAVAQQLLGLYSERVTNEH